jgi:hypothetical protein
MNRSHFKPVGLICPRRTSLRIVAASSLRAGLNRKIILIQGWNLFIHLLYAGKNQFSERGMVPPFDASYRTKIRK